MGTLQIARRPQGKAFAPGSLDAGGGTSEMELLRDAAAQYCEGVQRRMVAEAAYYRAEHRGFEPGHELEDWLAAEADIIGSDLRQVTVAHDIS